MEIKLLMLHTDGDGSFSNPKILDYPQQLSGEDGVADVATDGKWRAIGIPMPLVVGSVELLNAVNLVITKMRQNQQEGVYTSEVWIERILLEAVRKCVPDDERRVISG